MPLVVRTALELLRRPAGWISATALALLGLLLLTFPLFGLPGLELGLAVSVTCTLLGGWVGAAAADALRKPPRPSVPRIPSPGPARAAVWAVGAATLLLLGAATIPFLAAVLHASLATRCSPWTQAGFYPLLVIPAAVLASSAGVFCRAAFPRHWGGTGLYALLLLASVAWTCWPLLRGPQVFVWNFFAGFFPGPLYDEALRVPAALWWFRVETLLWAALLGGFAAGIFPAPGPSHRRHKSRIVVFLFFVAAGIALIEARAVELGFRGTDTSVRAALGGRLETPHAELLFPREKPPEEVERFRRDVEFRLAQLERFFGAPSPLVHVYLFRSAEEKQRLVGAGGTQFAKPWLRSAFLNDAPFPHPTLKHELAHLAAAPFGSGPFRVTSRLWLVPVMGVVEGVAVAADDPPGELELHAWAAGMRRQALLPDLAGLLGPAGFWSSAPARAYTAAGSFILWLQQSQGTEKLQRLLPHGDFARVYGRGLPSLVAEWERMLDGLPLNEGAVNRAFARFREPSLFRRPCVREVAGLLASARSASTTDPALALRLLHRCAELQPEEPDHLLAEATLLQRLNRGGEATEALDRAESVVGGHPTLEAQVALARADLAWGAGDTQAAGTALEQARSFHPGLDMEREVEVKRAALADSRISAAVHSYFDAPSDELRLWALERARQTVPDSAVVNYLLGRRLLMLGHPAQAAEALQRALAQSLPDAVAREAWRLLVAAHYQTGDCAAVHTDLGRLPDLGAALRAEVTEWQARCDFEGRVFNGPLVPRAAFR
jgi:tetratricopeptide (TPR) repeat protein